ncbi:MAG: TIGR03943 family protein [Oscillatoriales cyanobacterium RM1_1_9]|nr:TIGR03943 family protein [Oscillatoriales cyanobacterium SM2_3_0]NJO44212.1 TIGR03943 family protein [Oscillatoriales cyanobacterium RM2_1_1]NJO71289.1 TIGR03943 family protein [Oscillatoriales cyanobacterium RM1_1_9]
MTQFKKYLNFVQPWVDPLGILLWAVVLLKYWITGKLNILIHPNYFGLTVLGGLGLLAMGTLKLWQVLVVQGIIRSRTFATIPAQNQQHMTLFPPGWSSRILLGVAIVALVVTPRTFGSHTALQRGLTETLPVTRIQPQAFYTAAKPEERSLIEWMRLLNIDPEPDNYQDQAVNVTGFVIYPPSLPKGYLWLARFVITCCAADAYPVGLPVLLPENSQQSYPQDSWLEIKGQMTTTTLNDQRQLTIQAQSIQPIPEPRNPYDY